MKNILATFFTSQTMFDLSKMDDQVNLWNSQMTDSDEIFVLGDFAIDPISASEALKRIRGTLCCMPGIWDAQFLSSLSFTWPKSKLKVLFVDHLPLQEFNLVLSYWRMADWLNRDSGSLCIYGKIEAKESEKIIGRDICCSVLKSPVFLSAADLEIKSNS